LFIIIHQTYELWFKQILEELNLIIDHGKELRHTSARSSSENLAVFKKTYVFSMVRSLKRIKEIWNILLAQPTVLETITPLNFLEFRTRLGYASGFQSYQFKLIEATMGMKEQDHYQPSSDDTDQKGEEEKFYKKPNLCKGGFRDTEIQQIENIENDVHQLTLLKTVDALFEHMAWLHEDSKNLASDKLPSDLAWNVFLKKYGLEEQYRNLPLFWKQFTHGCWAFYVASQRGEEKWKDIIIKLIRCLHHGIEKEYSSTETKSSVLSAKGFRSALFVMSYYTHPLLSVPFRLINLLLEIEESMTLWRQRHLFLVYRTIGRRPGTTDSKTAQGSGANYLEQIIVHNNIFKDYVDVMTFIIPRDSLPKLSASAKDAMKFTHERI
jgi:tryptophan 2,3-dioxygenase